MVLGLQGYDTLQRYGSAEAVGTLVALSLVRELGPVVSALLFASRAGSAMTAEIGLMKATEQITALDMMAVDPIARIVGPRFWAGVLSMPLLAALFSAMGIFGGYLITVVLLGVDAGAFWSQMQASVDLREDVLNGVIKSIVFGVAVTAIALFEGYDAPPTAEGVSGATTRTVVTSSLAVLALDFVLTAFMFRGVYDRWSEAVLDLWVGIFVAAGLAALLDAGAQGEQCQHFQHRRQLPGHRRSSKTSAGSRCARRCKSAGVLVGRVEGIGFDNDKFVARVVLRLDRRYELPRRHHRLDPDLRAARRAVHRTGRGRRREDAEGRRHAQAHAVGRGAGEAHRPVPVRSRCARGCGQVSPRACPARPMT